MQFLLERLAAHPSLAEGRPEPFDLEGAVAAQIQRIVSSHTWEAMQGPLSLFDFGMPSVVDLAQGNKRQIEAYASRLAALIGKYEPRLQGARVRAEVGDGSRPSRLVVTGVLSKEGNDEQAFRFELPTH